MGQYPASTAALEAPTAASPKASANFEIMPKFYLLLTALPPDTTTRAVVRSGLPESSDSSLTKFVSLFSGTSSSSTWGDPLAYGDYSKLAGRKVKKLISCWLYTLVIAFPAYVGLRKVLLDYINVGVHRLQ